MCVYYTHIPVYQHLLNDIYCSLKYTNHYCSLWTCPDSEYCQQINDPEFTGVIYSELRFLFHYYLVVFGAIIIMHTLANGVRR